VGLSVHCFDSYLSVELKWKSVLAMFGYALGDMLTPEITVWFSFGRLTMSIASAPLNGASRSQQVGMRCVGRNCASVGLLLL
jgi:hypothetical protein